MKILTYISVLMSGLFFYGCKCHDVTCAGFDSRYSEWLPYKKGDTINFVNASGTKITFILKKVSLTAEQTYECFGNGLAGCRCHECEFGRGYIKAETEDTSYKTTSSWGTTTYFQDIFISIDNNHKVEDSVKLYYSILDQGSYVYISPMSKVKNGDSLFSSLTINNLIYYNVVLHQIDTSIPPNPLYGVYFVWKLYYNKEFGIIAFFDLKTNSLFYREF